MNNKKSKIGCFFGTFNPIHNGHMMMANYVLEHTDICRVIFVISPNSPFKEHTGDLLDFHHRCYLLNESIKSNLSLSYSDIESKLLSESEENKVYTYDTLCKLQELYEVDLKVKQDESIKQGKLKVEITKTYNDFLDENETMQNAKKVNKTVTKK